MALACSLKVDGFPGTWTVLRVEGEEALHELFRYEVEAAYDRPDPPPPGPSPIQGRIGRRPFAPPPPPPPDRGPEASAANLLGRKALVTIDCGADAAGNPRKRWLSGVLTACRGLGSILVGGESLPRLALRLEPALAAWDLDQAGDVHPSTTMRNLALALLAGKPGTAASEAAVAGQGVPHASGDGLADGPLRHQVVRFRESRYAFLRRILAEDGLHFCLVHVGPGACTGRSATDTADAGLGEHLVLLADGAASLTAKDEAGTTRAALPPAFGEAVSSGIEFGRLGAWEEERRELPWQVSVPSADYRDWSAGNAALPGTGSWDLVEGAAALRPATATDSLRRVQEVRDLAADSDDASTWGRGGALSANAWLARRRGEALLAQRRVVRAGGDHLRLGAGCTFTRGGEGWRVQRSRLRIIRAPGLTPGDELKAQPAAVQQTLLALARAELERVQRQDPSARPTSLGGFQVGWENAGLAGEIAIEAVPAAIPWRPPRPAAPGLAGVHTATVAAGASGGSAVSADPLGRVKVRFPWAAHDSNWLRVALPLAGAGWGFATLPRLGDAVAVVFPPDCPDRPVVVGCLHTAAHPPPVDLANDPGRIALRSRMLGGGQALPGSQPAPGRVGDLAVDDGGLWLDKKGDRNADALGYSEIALVDGHGASGRGLDIFTSGAMREQVAGDRSIKVGGTLKIEAGDAIELWVGDTMLRLAPTTTTLGFCNPTFPAFGSLIKINPMTIQAVAPVVDLKGWLRARLASSASSFSAQGAFAKSKGFACDMSSDAIQALGDTLGAAATVLCSAAQDAGDRETGRNQGATLVTVIKEFVLASIDLVKFVGIAGAKYKKSPADLFGDATIQAAMGLAMLKVKPPGVETLNKARTVLRSIQAVWHLGQGFTALSNNQDARTAGGVLGGIDGGLTAALGIMDLYDAYKGGLEYSSNSLTLAPVSGFELMGTKFYKVMFQTSDIDVQGSEKKLMKDKTALRDSETTGSGSETSLMDNQQQVVNQEGNGANLAQTGVDNDSQMVDSELELVKGNSQVVNTAAGALNSQGQLFTSHAPSPK